MNLHNYDTGRVIRPATGAEFAASKAAEMQPNGIGYIRVDGVGCYVMPPTLEPGTNACHPWGQLRMTRSMRPVPRVLAEQRERDGHTSLPDQTPIVGDFVRYIHRTLMVEVSPMCAMGGVLCGANIGYETYGS